MPAEPRPAWSTEPPAPIWSLEWLEQAAGRSRFAWWGVVAAIVVLAFAARWPWLHESLWIDELHSAWTISDGWSSIQERAARGNQLPAFFVALCGVVQLTGPSEAGFRLLSLVAGLALIPVLAHTVRCWTNSVLAGWAAALCVAMDNDFIFYSLEARPYACVQLLGAWLLAGLPALVHEPTGWRRARAVALQWAMFHLHPTAALMLPATLVGRFLATFSSDRRQEEFVSPLPSLGRTVRLLTVDALWTAAGWLPAVALLLEVYRQRLRWAAIPALTSDAASWRRAASTLDLSIYLGLPAICFAAAWFAGYLKACAMRSSSSHESGARDAPYKRFRSLDGPALGHALIAWSWALVPLTIVWVTTRSGWVPLLMTRYIWTAKLGAVVGAIVIAAVVPQPQWRAAALAILVIAVAGWIGPRSIGPQRVCEPWRESLDLVRREDPAGADLILVRPKLIESEEWSETAAADQSTEVAALWHSYGIFPLSTRIYPLPHTASSKVPLDNAVEPRLSMAQLQLVQPSADVWLIARGSRAETETVAASIERQLRELDPAWTRTLDEPTDCLRTTRWSHDTPASALRVSK